jgi:very-short-patch-repair endonuclease
MKPTKHYLKNNPNFVNKATRGGIVFNLKDVLTEEYLRDFYKEADLEKGFDTATTIVEQWNALRKLYEYHTPEIIERSKEDITAMIDPYLVNWKFSPIEDIAWGYIRDYGLPLYPQYPLGRFFIDFACPYLRLGVELDGKQYHNAEKDKKRDEWMAAQGWQVFRVPGRECYVKHKDFHEIREMSSYGACESEIHGELQRFFMETAEGVFKALEIMYFSQDGRLSSPYYRLAQESLIAHRSTPVKYDWRR